MQGKRRATVDNRTGENILFSELQAGDYWKVIYVDGSEHWYCLAPSVDGQASAIGNLSNHSIEEHEDGTITVSPSILIMPSGYHGFLERGVWRSA